ncbi:hypothetical protein [Bradyrhizobium barranii]
MLAMTMLRSALNQPLPVRQAAQISAGRAERKKKPRLSGAFESSCSISSASGSFGEPTRHDEVGGVSRFSQSTFVNSPKKKRLLAQRAADTDSEISSALHDFIVAKATRRLDMQLALPLRGRLTRNVGERKQSSQWPGADWQL